MFVDWTECELWFPIKLVSTHTTGMLVDHDKSYFDTIDQSAVLKVKDQYYMF